VEAGITVTLPKTMTSNSKAEGRVGRVKLPTRCVRFGMRTSSACCAAFAFFLDRSRAKP
jgi:hypothetical protein